MVRSIISGFLIFILCGKAFAGDPKPEMHGLALEISNLQKYMMTDADFAASENEQAIAKSLNGLSEHLSRLKGKKFSDDPSLRINLSLLDSHIADAKRSFQESSKPYARFMLQSSLQMCIACHTRIKTQDFSWSEPNEEKTTLAERAEYYFATRQFQKGQKLYEEVVVGYPANKAGYSNMRKALLALAVYYARVKEDPLAGADYFKIVAKSASIPDYMRKEMQSWSQEFERWSKEKKVVGKNLTETQLVKEAKALLRKDDFSLVDAGDRNFHIRRLRASSLLHRALEAPGAKSPAKAEALYYLGQIYHRISSVFFFRFGEMYLKACIQEYPKTATARDCYGALEMAVREGYTGSAGTDVPADEEVELMRLRRLAY